MTKPIRIKKEALDEEAPYDNWIDDHIFIRLTLKPKKKETSFRVGGVARIERCNKLYIHPSRGSSSIRHARLSY